MFWYLCLWRAAGRARSAHHRAHHQIISDELSCCWHSADYKLSFLSLARSLRPFGSLTAEHTWLCIPLMHIACFVSFRMQKLCAREFDIPHHPLFALGRAGINLQHTGCRALPHLNGKYFVSAHTLHSGLNMKWSVKINSLISNSL